VNYEVTFAVIGDISELVAVSDLTVRRTAPGWGDSWVPCPVRDLRDSRVG